MQLDDIVSAHAEKLCEDTKRTEEHKVALMQRAESIAKNFLLLQTSNHNAESEEILLEKIARELLSITEVEERDYAAVKRLQDKSFKKLQELARAMHNQILAHEIEELVEDTEKILENFAKEEVLLKELYTIIHNHDANKYGQLRTVIQSLLHRISDNLITMNLEKVAMAKMRKAA
jgi:hypothetical protein